MKLAIVVQRYGAEINGGAELHARYIAEHLSRHADVEVLTTCARDYVTWRDEYPAGMESINDVAVRRFRVDQERDVHLFARLSDHVFGRQHSYLDELKWLDAEGPEKLGVADACTSSCAYDYVLFFSYRYFHAYHGVRAAPSRAILVPTAERDEAVGLAISPRIFRGVRALMYNSPEERRMIQAVSSNHDVPGVVVGIGSEIARQQRRNAFARSMGSLARSPCTSAASIRTKVAESCSRSISMDFKRCREVLRLVLIGKALLPIPDHPRIHHLGFLDDQEKFDALAAADLLVMPSYYESLSMVALEAWAVGKPVLANGKCEVLRGQCIRSKAGLYYEKQARIHRDAANHRREPDAECRVRGKRPAVFPAALCMAGH